MNWQNKKVLVAGMGGTGVSLLAFLTQAGAEVSAYDEHFNAERQIQLQQQFVGLK